MAACFEISISQDFLDGLFSYRGIDTKLLLLHYSRTQTSENNASYILFVFMKFVHDWFLNTLISTNTNELACGPDLTWSASITKGSACFIFKQGFIFIGSYFSPIRHYGL